MFRKKGEEKHTVRRVARGVFLLGVFAALAAVWGPSIYTNLITKSERYELSTTPVSAIPKREVGVVFGAGLKNNGTAPSDYLKWRIETGVALYKAGKVDRLLMTGDGSFRDHDEPYIMRREAIALGVPADKIAMDKFGFDTYDSCTRALRVRSISSATLVTQGYHLPRAVFSCQAVGIDAIGVNAMSKPLHGWSAYAIAREWLSTDKLFLQLARHSLSGTVRWTGY